LERVIIFIDGSNVFRSIQNYNHDNGKSFRIDYLKLAESICNGRNLIRSYYYGSEDVPSSEAHSGFLNKLRSSGFEVVSKPLKVYVGIDGVQTKFEKGIDVSLATDFISLAWENAFDTAVIVSGDSDYFDAIKRVKQKGKKVEIASFRNSMAGDMKTLGDRTIILDNLVADISLQ
ncbi:MAG: NYN domain-containing protein, partial [Thermoplasmatales archaeon]